MPEPHKTVNDTIPYEKLIEDTWLLARTIEDVHPEPYLETGGRIGFYRHLHKIISAIPDEGMTVGDYYFLAREVVSMLPDAHTWIGDPVLDSGITPGLPVYCTYLDGEMVIIALYKPGDASVIGSKLIAVEGISIETLLDRIENIMNSENRVQSAYLLSSAYGFLSSRHLSFLLPEWSNHKVINITVKDPGGKIADLRLEVPSSYAGLQLVYNPSGYILPSTEKSDFAWSFAGSDSSTALLVVKGTMDFRENFEIWSELGIAGNLARAGNAYRRANGEEPPGNIEEVIAGIPSASDFIREMVIRMKEERVANLIVDLRGNEGGTSFFADLLLYYLFGKEELLRIKSDYGMITRFSDYYFKYSPGSGLDELNSLTGFIHQVNDYDFSGEYIPGNGRSKHGKQEETFEKWVAMMKGFNNEYLSGAYSGYYCPGNIYVITGSETFSAGLTFAAQLKKAGALVAGTASRQAPNCFGDILVYQLPNSGLKCNISHKKFEYFPGDTVMGRMLQPDLPLTYSKFVDYGFDLNAELLLVLDHIK